MSKNNFNNKKGFTFVEVLVSTVLLAFVIIGIMTMIGAYIKTNAFATKQTKGIQLAEEAVEGLLRVDAVTLTNYGTQSEAYGAINRYPEFSRQVTVTQIDNNNYRISAAVRWKSQGKGSKPIVISMLRTL
jgi:Tfp pilus assembly protein PilV